MSPTTIENTLQSIHKDEDGLIWIAPSLWVRLREMPIPQASQDMQLRPPPNPLSIPRITSPSNQMISFAPTHNVVGTCTVSPTSLLFSVKKRPNPTHMHAVVCSCGIKMSLVGGFLLLFVAALLSPCLIQGLDDQEKPATKDGTSTISMRKLSHGIFQHIDVVGNLQGKNTTSTNDQVTSR
ncbi:hypothetical protein RJ639_018441 [Escallonia herrerae]|uniref:Transmembrane protein n=1 Tax=Escallonia herrerae TaxID=1293975 RepID=A0AA88V8X2_9ASTE|nr:hypothetical protein RJ639_018441 [Escallonia herrerae]